MTVGSCFTGIGAIDLGFERAGFDVAWQVEIDPKCRRVLVKHWPNVPKHDDIHRVGAHNLATVDVVCGGPPCQPFSSASRGRRQGTTDARWLWPEMRRVVSELRPTWVLGENVPHIDGPALEQVVADLEALGYEVAPPFEIPACAFGHNHRRARYWFLGYADRHGKPGVPVDAALAGMPSGEGDTGSVGASDGAPSRMDRLAMLGNAVVVEIAEWFATTIREVTA